MPDHTTSDRVRLIVACGSRTYTSALAIRDTLTDYVLDRPVIIHGAARGADRLIGFEADDIGLTVKAMPPRYNDGETPLQRNDRMLDENPDLVLAFWDGKSRGTLHTISHAVQRGIPVRIVPA